jgi:hypothetical protein
MGPHEWGTRHPGAVENKSVRQRLNRVPFQSDLGTAEAVPSKTDLALRDDRPKLTPARTLAGDPD